MSSIDSYDNVHVANLHLCNVSVIPVYWCFNGATHDRGCEVSKNDLMIGGGSGEHPALQIMNADLLPIWAHLQSMRYSERRNDSLEAKLIDSLKSRTTAAEHWEIEQYSYSAENFVDFSDWPLSSLSKIQCLFEHEDFEKEREEYHDAERAFLHSVAHFVMYVMPKQFYKDQEIFDLVKKISQTKTYVFPVYMFSSPFANRSMGKVIKDGKVVWGYSLQDYLNDHKED